MKQQSARGLAVFFPGRGYTCREPLMQKCIAHYAAQGYETRCLDFSMLPLQTVSTLEQAAALARPQAEAQLAGVDWQAYSDVAFVSKSLGTACAAWMEPRLPRGVRPNQLYLTPLPQTLPFVTGRSRVMGMVLGTEDRFLEAAVLREFCARYSLPCLIVPGVGHSLRRPDPAETEEIDRRIIALCRP